MIGDPARMKRLIIFIGVIGVFALLALYSIETFNILRLDVRELGLECVEEGGTIYLKWTPFKYPCRYIVTAYTPTTGVVKGVGEYHRLWSEEVTGGIRVLKDEGIEVMYDVEVRGLMGVEFGRSDKVEDVRSEKPLRARVESKDREVSLKPYIRWSKVPGAVCYELEVLSSQDNSLLQSTREIYRSGTI